MNFIAEQEALVIWPNASHSPHENWMVHTPRCVPSGQVFIWCRRTWWRL